MIGKSRLSLLFSLFLLLGTRLLWGQTIWNSRTDWERMELRLHLETSVPREGTNRPAADLAAQERIARELPAIFTQAARPVLVDSRHSLAELVENTPALGKEILKAAEMGRKDFPTYSPDLGRINILYSFPLYEALGSLFVRHRNPRPVPTVQGWRPTKEFTGLVIYAKGELPVHGEDASAHLRPCLFPKIFDSQMDPVLLTSMGKPEYLKKWGSAAYTRSFDEDPWQERIGKDPFRILATGLFGIHHTDPKIPRSDAERFLRSPSAEKILAEGRILIICDLD